MSQVWICFLLIMILPAWFWYILPNAQPEVALKPSEAYARAIYGHK